MNKNQFALKKNGITNAIKDNEIKKILERYLKNDSINYVAKDDKCVYIFFALPAYKKALNGWDFMLEKRTFQAIGILQQSNSLYSQYKIQAFSLSNKLYIDVLL